MRLVFLSCCGVPPGVAEEERYGSEDEGAFARAEEAEEVGEEEAEAEEGTLKAVLAARKKGRKKDDESKLERDVDALVAQVQGYEGLGVSAAGSRIVSC